MSQEWHVISPNSYRALMRLTDERFLGSMRKLESKCSPHSLPEVRAVAEGDGGAVRSFRSKMS